MNCQLRKKCFHIKPKNTNNINSPLYTEKNKKANNMVFGHTSIYQPDQACLSSHIWGETNSTECSTKEDTNILGITTSVN